jgi:hypothetical protein
LGRATDRTGWAANKNKIHQVQCRILHFILKYWRKFKSHNKTAELSTYTFIKFIGAKKGADVQQIDSSTDLLFSAITVSYPYNIVKKNIQNILNILHGV